MATVLWRQLRHSIVSWRRNGNDDDTVKSDFDTTDFFRPDYSRRPEDPIEVRVRNPLIVSLAWTTPFLILFPLVCYAIVHYSGVLEEPNESRTALQFDWRVQTSFRLEPNGPVPIALSSDGTVLAFHSKTESGWCVQAYELDKQLLGDGERPRQRGQPICERTFDFVCSKLVLSENGRVLALSGLYQSKCLRSVRVFEYNVDRWELRGSNLVMKGCSLRHDFALSDDGNLLAVTELQRNDTALTLNVYSYCNETNSTDWNLVDQPFGFAGGQRVLFSALSISNSLLVLSATVAGRMDDGDVWLFSLGGGADVECKMIWSGSGGSVAVSDEREGRFELALGTNTMLGRVHVHSFRMGVNATELAVQQIDIRRAASTTVALSKDGSYLAAGSVLESRIYRRDGSSNGWSLQGVLLSSNFIALASTNTTVRVVTSSRPEDANMVVVHELKDP